MVIRQSEIWGLKTAVMEAMKRRYGYGGEGRMGGVWEREEEGRLRWKKNREDGES